MYNTNAKELFGTVKNLLNIPNFLHLIVRFNHSLFSYQQIQPHGIFSIT